MRVFQNSSLYPAYLPRLRELSRNAVSFSEHLERFICDRYAALHVLKPVLSGDKSSFFANGNHLESQRAWARERGMPSNSTLEAILLAQIEDHCSDVFYNLDPIRYGDVFVSKLPVCVKRSIAWRAAPSPHENFGRYDLVVSNFPQILQSYADRGFRTAYFFPAHDPEMDRYADRSDRPIDVLFVGGYTRHHIRRARILENVARLSSTYRIDFHLDRSRFTRLAESPLGLLPPLRRHRRPTSIRKLSKPGVFGRDLYEKISLSKVVLNAAVDMAGDARGNMRCFEAMGCGALLLSDQGQYPEGMVSYDTLVTYSDPEEAVTQIERILGSPSELSRIASRGHAMVREIYSKDRQWTAFLKLCE